MSKVLESLFVCLILIASTQAHALSCAAVVGDVESAVVDPQLSPRLLDRITRLEAEYGHQAKNAVLIMSEITDLKNEISKLKSGMKTRERYLISSLAKLLGGDAQKIEDLRLLQNELTKAQKDLALERARASQSDQNIFETVNQFLRNADERFESLRQTEEALYRVVCNGNACLASVEDALKAVENVKSDLPKHIDVDLTAEDVPDGFQDWIPNMVRLEGQIRRSEVTGLNLGLLTSKYATKDAFEEAEAFEYTLAEVETTLAAAKTAEVSPRGPVNFVFSFYLSLNVESALNSVFAQVFKSFVFTDVQTQLEDLHTNVREQTDQAQSDYEKLKEELDQQVCRVREICR